MTTPRAWADCSCHCWRSGCVGDRRLAGGGATDAPTRLGPARRRHRGDHGRGARHVDRHRHRASRRGRRHTAGLHRGGTRPPSVRGDLRRPRCALRRRSLPTGSAGAHRRARTPRRMRRARGHAVRRRRVRRARPGRRTHAAPANGLVGHGGGESRRPVLHSIRPGAVGDRRRRGRRQTVLQSFNRATPAAARPPGSVPAANGPGTVPPFVPASACRPGSARSKSPRCSSAPSPPATGRRRAPSSRLRR